MKCYEAFISFIVAMWIVYSFRTKVKFLIHEKISFNTLRFVSWVYLNVTNFRLDKTK